jgi:RHS repeat-associated protein
LLSSVTKVDAQGNQIGQTDYGYDAHERQNTVTDARNGTTTNLYNVADLVVTNITPAPGVGQSPEVTVTLYDNLLRPSTIIQPDGTVVTNVYLTTGSLGAQFGSRTYPVGYSYDPQGRMKTMTNWSNFSSLSGARVTTWNYDAYRGFLSSKTYDGNAAGPSYTYTGAGRLASRLWARGVSTAYLYGSGGDLTNVVYSGLAPGVTNVYDRLGRLNHVSWTNIIDNLMYDKADDLLTESYTGGALDGLAITNIYDQFLRRTNVTLMNGSSPLASALYGYDAASRLVGVTNLIDNDSATYSYLANSPLVSQITFNQIGATRMTTSKLYDYLNRLTQISSAASAAYTLAQTFNYNYNPANQRTKDTLADGSYWIYGYDSLGQVTNSCKYFANGTLVPGQQFDYTFDTVGNRLQTMAGGDTSGANLRLANYTNNSLNQITGRDVPAYVDIMGASIATNRVTVNGQTAYRNQEYYRQQVPANNFGSALWTNVIVSGGINVTGNVYLAHEPELFSYDADGNLTNDGRWSYTWDAENRLIGMTVNTNVGPQYQLTFTYDPKGRRIQELVVSNSVAISTNRFLYDGWNLVAELNPAGSPVRTYLWGTDLSGSAQGAGGVGGLLEVSYTGSATTNCFPAFDGNGNVTALVNATNGAVVANYEYGPFGEVIRATGPMAKANPIRFSTKYDDDESDLLYYGYRYYKPSTGTWVNRDPLAALGSSLLGACRAHTCSQQFIELTEGPNLFVLTTDDPEDYVDTDGEGKYKLPPPGPVRLPPVIKPPKKVPWPKKFWKTCAAPVNAITCTACAGGLLDVEATCVGWQGMGYKSYNLCICDFYNSNWLLKQTCNSCFSLPILPGVGDLFSVVTGCGN